MPKSNRIVNNDGLLRKYVRFPLPPLDNKDKYYSLEV